MRALLVGLLLVHGLIHLIGPAKAFGWVDLPDLRLGISSGTAIAWLVAAMLFVSSAVLIVVERPFPSREWWWLAAFPAVALSQILIVRAWQDARFGTIANVVILVPSIIAALGSMPTAYRAIYAREVRTQLAAPAEPAPAVIDKDLVSMPAVVQRYLRFMGVVGRPRVRDVRIRFVGTMRSEPSSVWMPSVVEQHNFFNPNSRFFIMKASLYGLPFEALHIFKGPAATFEVKAAGVARMMDARGPEMDQSETVTMLNDMCLLAPASLIDPRVSWSEATERRARVTFTHEGRTVSAVLSFDDDGSLANFESDDRYRTIGTTQERATWSTPISRYGDVDGVKVPLVADARWKSSEYDFSYARFEITGIAFNRAALPRNR
jgi:hypothetical protein